MRDILLVDNENAILNGLATCMDWQAHGCRIAATARNGLEAVHLIEQTEPDIVISDIRMPDMDGLALAKWVMEHAPQVKVILLTGFPDFDYAQQAISYRVVDFVLKPSTEEKLVQAIEKACGQIDRESDQRRTSRLLADREQQSLELKRNLLLYDLIYRANLSNMFAYHRVAELGLNLLDYHVLRLGVASKAPDCDYAAFLQHAQHILQECLSGQTPYFVPKADRFCYVVLCKADEEEVRSACLRAVSIAGEQSEFLLTIGMSRRQNDPLSMHQAARQADHAQHFAEYSLQMPVVRYDDLPALSPAVWKTVTDELKLFESALERHNRSCVEETLARLFAFVRLQKLPLSSVQRICSIIRNFCVGLLFSYDRSDCLSDAQTLALEPLFERGSLDEIEQQLTDFVCGVFDGISAAPGNIDSIIFSIKCYVDQNYAQPLSLESLASQVHLSTSYLSKLFKREIGENLSVYILNVRIEHAKLLLRSTDMKTYEIAEAVGIGDPVYFSKLFKKAVGCKPKEYRADGERATGQEIAANMPVSC